MTYQIDTQGSFYLVSILSFNVGTQVTLYGAIQITTAKDFRFVLSKDMVIDPKLLPAGQDTPSVDAPFGMTGVQLQDFEVQARIYKDPNAPATDPNATKIDFRVNASARFISKFNLSGAIVFENGSPRLALASFLADSALTLTQFFQGVTGTTWPWIDGITDQFAFQSGDMYYLNPPANAPSDYTYNYQYKDRQFTCSPGYRMDAVLQIFQRFNFHITLSVGSPTSSFGGLSTMELQGTLPAIDIFDFLNLRNLTLSISTGLGSSMSIGADVTLLNTDIGHLDASYDSSNSAFSGGIEGGLLPSPITSVAFVWTQSGGFRITSIGGLPDQLLDFMKFVQALNKLLKGGCQAILNEWFKDLSTTLKVTTNGSPSKDGTTMNVPLTLRYEITAPGGLSNSGSIGFTVNFPLPRHLDELFGAIGQFLLNNMEGIAGKILSNPDTYKVIAAYVATTYGKQALARLICRALDTPELSPNPDVAKDLSKTDVNVGDTLEGTAELAAQLTRVALLDVPQIVTGLVGILGLISELADKLKNFFGSLAAKLGLEHEKNDAEDKRDDFHQQITTQCQHAQDVLNNLLAEVTSYQGAIRMTQIDLRLDQGKVYVATWRPAKRNTNGVVPPAAVVCELLLLDKDRNTLWSSSANGSNPLYADQMPCAIQKKDIHSQAPVVYASIASSIANLQLMDDMTKQQIGNVLNQLDGANDDVATDWANKLRATLQLIPSQVTTSPVSTMLLGLVVGNSFIGLNTRI